MSRRVGLDLVCEMCVNASAARTRMARSVGLDLEADGAQLVVAEEDGIVGPGPPLW